MRIFNIFWKRFPKKKPWKNGWYLCTVEFEYADNKWQSYVMQLFWDQRVKNIHDDTYGAWINNTRKDVFDTYDVFLRDKNSYHVIETDRLCDRTSTVIAWRKLPIKFISKKVIDTEECYGRQC